MKEGLLGGTFVVSPSSESKEARVHVARWIGFESWQGRPSVCCRRRARSSRKRVAALGEPYGLFCEQPADPAWGGPVEPGVVLVGREHHRPQHVRLDDALEIREEP